MFESLKIVDENFAKNIANKEHKADLKLLTVDILSAVKKHLDAQTEKHQREIALIKEAADKSRSISERLYMDYRNSHQATVNEAFKRARKEVVGLSKTDMKRAISSLQKQINRTQESSLNIFEIERTQIEDLIQAIPDAIDVQFSEKEKSLLSKSAKKTLSLQNQVQTIVQRFDQLPTRDEVAQVAATNSERITFLEEMLQAMSQQSMADTFLPDASQMSEERFNAIRKELHEIEARIREQIKKERIEPRAATFPVLSEPRHGSQWYFSNGDPSRDTGENGDVNMDLDSGNVQKKIDGNWILQGTLVGSGTSEPATGLENPQVFSPTAGEVSGGTSSHTLPDAETVVIVAINGVVYDDAHWTQTGTGLAITPPDGFFDSNDRILVYQNAQATGGLALPQVFNPSGAEATANSSSHTVASSQTVIMVAVNGMMLPDADWTQVGTGLTVSPSLGYVDDTDEVLVWQNAQATEGLAAAQESSPNASEVAGGSKAVVLSTTSSVQVVALNGIIMDDASWTQSGTSMTLTPPYGFGDTSDNIQVYQNA